MQAELQQELWKPQLLLLAAADTSIAASRHAQVDTSTRTASENERHILQAYLTPSAGRERR